MPIRGAMPASCFGLNGTDENAATAALGWCLDNCSTFRQELLRRLAEDPNLELSIASQVFAEDGGFTDLELIGQTKLHVIIEAKVGWQVPSISQLDRYLPRLLASNSKRKLFVSVSAADGGWAKRHLPTHLAGVEIMHLSWSDLQAIALMAFKLTRRPADKLWLSQLATHLAEYGMTSNVFDARAYVVSISPQRITPKHPLTWVDVIVEQRRYFHPIGGNGWPVVAPSYLGFRYHGAFRSAHFVESVVTIDNLAEIDSRWPETNTPNFVYTLGPPMQPATPLPLGKIWATMRNWVSLDLLLSGAATDYSEALAMMKARNQNKYTMADGHLSEAVCN